MDLKKHLYTLACTVVAAGAAQSVHAAENNWFKVLDWNTDGSVSLVELQAARNTRFFNMDSNADHKLSFREASKSAEWQKRFEHLDTNKDGEISLGEFESKGRARFTAIDGNKDGRITPEEALAFQRKARQNWEANLRKRKTG